jgi:glutathione reductase (NADPH)
MAKYDYDLFAIGGGSGGVRTARFAANLGVKVALAEERYLGGTCVNVGCIPKKLFSYASHFSEEFIDAEGFGWEVGKPQFDWQTLVANKDREIRRLNGIYENLLKNSGVTTFNAHAEIIDEHTVEVENKRYTSEKILIATGGWPYVPPFPGSEYAITSNEAFYLKKLPSNVVIVGGGYIAVEFAGIFNGLGCKTHQIYRGPMFLRGFDLDAADFLAMQMRKKGIDLLLNSEVSSITQMGDRYQVLLDSGGKIDTDLVMYATGRTPMTDGLGLESCGIAVDNKNAIVVDGNYRTNCSSVYAIGDVTNRVNLTPLALAEGIALVAHLYQKNEKPVSYEYIPCAVFSNPNLASVGYDEESARKKFGKVTVYQSSFKALKHTLTMNDEKTFMKLIVNTENDKVVGAHMVGPDAGESIQGIAIALKAGATKKNFDQTIGIHPTSAEEWVTMREPVR